MAALREDHRRGGLAVVPVAAHERVRHVRVHDRLLVLDAHDLADKSRIKRFLERAKVRRVAEHMPHRDHHARLALTREQIKAFALSLRHGLLEQHVVALAHRLHGGFVVKVVGQRHEHDVRKFAVSSGIEKFVIVAEAALGRDPPRVAHRVAARGVDVRDRHHAHRAGEQLPVGGIFVAARARAHDRDGQFAACLDFQRFDFRQRRARARDVHFRVDCVVVHCRLMSLRGMKGSSGGTRSRARWRHVA